MGFGTYREIRVNGKLEYGHRLAWIYVHGFIPEGMEIDHLDGDGTNNRIANLRLVTSSENKQNMKRRIDNRSGVTGVNWHRSSGKWAASIMLNGKSKHLGLFVDIDSAVATRKNAERQCGFHENHGMR